MKKVLGILIIASVIVLGGCAATRGSSEGELGPNKMRKSPCAELLTLSRHV